MEKSSWILLYKIFNNKLYFFLVRNWWVFFVNNDTWWVPKWHIHKLETNKENAIREFKEETWINDIKKNKLEYLGIFKQNDKLMTIFAYNYTKYITNFSSNKCIIFLKWIKFYNYETIWWKWFTLENAMNYISKWQRQILLRLNYLKNKNISNNK